MRTTFLTGIALAALLGAGQGTQARQPGTDALLGEALHHEQVTGDLQSAIDGYKRVLASKGVSRSAAAQAQYHLGLCYEKLGKQEARRAFESVVKNYADQKDFAAQAAARLAGLPHPAGAVRSRLLWDNALSIGGRISADGRHLPFMDWSTCDVAVRDLATGENRRLTDNKSCREAPGEASGMAASPDGKRVAFSYRYYKNPAGGRAELLLIGMDGKDQKVLVPAGKRLDWIDPVSWSPDGRWIATTVVYRDESGEEDAILLVDTQSGQSRRFNTRDRLWARNLSFSPDGKWLAYSLQPDRGIPALYVRSAESENSVETAVSEKALMMGWGPDGSVLFVREEGGNRDLYRLPMAAGKAAGNAAPIYTSLPAGSGPSGMTTGGALVYSTYNRRTEALVLPWNGETTADGTAIATLPATTEISWLLGRGAVHFSPDSRRLLVVNPTTGVTIRDLQSGDERTVVPQLKSWKVARWAHEGSALLLFGENASGKTGVHRMELATGKAELIAEMPAETWSFTPSRDGKTLFHGTPNKTQARDLMTGRDRTLFEVERGGNYDLRVSHDGTRLAIRGGVYLAIVDLRTGQARQIYQVPADSGTAVWALDWSPDDRQLYANVRTTGDANRLQTWIFSPEGGEPRKLENKSLLPGLAVSPDGKYVATTRMTQRWQVWSLENLLAPAK